MDESTLLEPSLPLSDTTEQVEALPADGPDNLEDSAQSALFEASEVDENAELLLDYSQHIDFYDNGNAMSGDEEAMSDTATETPVYLSASVVTGKSKTQSSKRSSTSHQTRRQKVELKSWIPTNPKPALISASSTFGRAAASPEKPSPKKPVDKEVAGMSQSLRPIVSQLMEGIYIRPVTISILIPNYDRSPSPELRDRQQRHKQKKRTARRHKIRYFRVSAHDLAEDRSASTTVKLLDLIHFQKTLVKTHENERAVRECCRLDDMEWWKRNLRFISVFDKPTGQLVVMVNYALIGEHVSKYVAQYRWMAASLATLPPHRLTTTENSSIGDLDADFNYLIAPQAAADGGQESSIAEQETIGSSQPISQPAAPSSPIAPIAEMGKLSIEVHELSASEMPSPGSSLPDVHSKSSPMPRTTSPMLDGRPSYQPPRTTSGAGRRGDADNRNALSRQLRVSRPASSPVHRIQSSPGSASMSPSSFLPSLIQSPPKSPKPSSNPGTPAKLSERTHALLHNIYLDQQDISRLHQLIEQESATKELNYRIYLEYKKEGHGIGRKRHTYDSITSDYKDILRPRTSPYPPRVLSRSPSKSPPPNRSPSRSPSPVIGTPLLSSSLSLSPLRGSSSRANSPKAGQGRDLLPPTSLWSSTEKPSDLSQRLEDLPAISGAASSLAKGSLTASDIIDTRTPYEKSVSRLEGSSKRAAGIIQRARAQLTNDATYRARKPSNMEIQLFFSPLAKRLVPSPEEKVQKVVDKIVFS